MKKLQKKEMRSINGGIDPCFTFCAAQFSSCLAAGTPKPVCQAQRAECWLICPQGV
jgi:hypothetical protein